jgi:3-hydroxymyristoyl/3-hydroxydecanoyl-(acyl carrier protein) dehydratase
LDDKGHELLLTLHIPPELEHFSGHFENVPILPGVIQIDWAVRLAQKYLKQAGELNDGFSGMERLKFLAPVPPDIRLTLHLKWHPQTRRLDFAYSTPQRNYSTGQLFFNRNSCPILPVC